MRLILNMKHYHNCCICSCH